MPRVKLNQLVLSKRIELLEMLEEIGRRRLKDDLYNSLLYILSTEDLNDKEFLSRYLLLAAILDQQAESDSARRLALEIYRGYGRDFFLHPQRYIADFDPIMNLAINLYQPKTRVLRIKKEGMVLLRLGGFLLAMLSIERRYGGSINYLKRSGSPKELLQAILNNPYLSGLLYEKAARMYVGWISHPKLYIALFGNISPSSIPMVINGHVCKVLSRAGFLDYVLVESDRPIVKAEDERNRIEMLVHSIYPHGDPFMIDYGAFYIGINYCGEENPQCGKCPINSICLRNTYVRAY